MGVPDLSIVCHEILLGLEVLHEADGAVQSLLGAVHPAPGLAGEVGHVVHCAVGTKLAKLFTFVANVIQLTLSLKISIISKKRIMNTIRSTTIYLYIHIPSILFVLTGKGRYRHLHSIINWKIYSGFSQPFGEAKVV